MSDFEPFLLKVLVQLAVIVAAARLGAWCLSKLGQPQVVGEIMAGLVLGPSVLGNFSPGFASGLFPTDTAVSLRVLSELGLILLMFLIGLEFDFSHLQRVGPSAAAIASAGIVVPFILGLVLALWIQPHVAPAVNRAGFALIIAVALSITAIPILGRMMIDLGIQRTSLGTMTISAAAIDDAIGWILLAGVSSMIHGQFSVPGILRMIVLVVLFLCGSWLVCRWMFRPWIDYVFEGSSHDLSQSGLALVLVAVFIAAALTNAIGVFSILGPFVLGAELSKRHDFREAVSRRLRGIVYALLLPIFFTYTGMRTNIGLLHSGKEWLICGLVIAVAIMGKMGGCGLAARCSGMTWRESGCVAAMMNTRALMGLIAINAGREMGVVPDNVFCMLVIMALVTTLMTAPLLGQLLPKRETLDC